MARKTKSKSQTDSDTPKKRAPKSPQSLIPEPFQIVGQSTERVRGTKKKVPRLVLEGEWLRACGFPIGAAACLTTDRRGEMALNRLGLGLPRRIWITAVNG